MTDTALLSPSPDGQRYNLHNPTALPRAAAFLWNQKMMILLNCRGYAVAQHMQPEPAKYAYAPNLEAKTFMQPEQPYYAHHPGRFIYVKDEESGELFSAPYEPVRKAAQSFMFSAGQGDVCWQVRDLGIEITLKVGLPTCDVVELWSLQIKNLSGRTRRLSIYPFFTIGYMSWMNQGAQHRADLGGIVASCVTPYQKVADYPTIKTLKDKTFLLYETPPMAWETARETFEGEGGLHCPDGVAQETLSCGDAWYESPAAVLQYRETLQPGEQRNYRFLFGPARDDHQISRLRQEYLSEEGFRKAEADYANYLQGGQGAVQIRTPDPHLDNFVNHWLCRQMFYHGDVNRLTTDPQTRNYLQDNMGMSYLKPTVARAAFVHALSQQEASGAMPDGILLTEQAQLKYINQVPHTDHCVWLPVCLQAYLDETGDEAILDEIVKDSKGEVRGTVFEGITRAMRWLIQDRDARGLNYIAQGDWCDPMNMVGHRGKGVSGWLSIATVHALKLWADVAAQHGQPQIADEMLAHAAEITASVQKHLWDGNWFARGITDDGVRFGISSDEEGRIFLNPQSWAMMAGIPTPAQQELMLQAIEQQMETPWGPVMCAPAYTQMREDVGRVTQKWPGSAENGSIYNHAAAFYIFSLYGQRESERAYRVLRQMIPGPSNEDVLRRGQLPVFIPNYYRGAHRQYPQAAGRSSQLFNTGTVGWFFRCAVEQLFGLKGCREGLRVDPQLPETWPSARIQRRFRGATFDVQFVRGEAFGIQVNGVPIPGHVIRAIEPDRRYEVLVTLRR
jgi:cellobionic acid phosphorylase